ncbi:hypothetical protein HYPSUDRAFT_117364, partial [Hypholoma sublateritium FD-334 SS-4]
ADRAVRDDKKRQEEEKRAAKAVVTNENHRRRATEAHTMIFPGSLAAKNKQYVGDLAYCLGLSTDGTKAKILERIKEHFAANPDLKTQDQYIGLFNSTRSRKRA